MQQDDPIAIIKFWFEVHAVVIFITAKKPKKGLATAKQRLGKILKINKLGMF